MLYVGRSTWEAVPLAQFGSLQVVWLPRELQACALGNAFVKDFFQGRGQTKKETIDTRRKGMVSSGPHFFIVHFRRRQHSPASP